MKNFQKLFKPKFRCEKCRFFFQKLFLVNFVENKGTRVKEGHILKFSKEKSEILANSTKNDLLKFEGKKREIAQNSRNFNQVQPVKNKNSSQI